MKRYLIAAVVGLSMMAQPSYAETAETLLSDCEQALQGMRDEGDSVRLRLGGGEGYSCLGYITGVEDAGMLTDDGVYSILHVCLPDGTTNTQIIRIVVNHGHTHPEQLNKMGVQFVISALQAAFPCPHE